MKFINLAVASSVFAASFLAEAADFGDSLTFRSFGSISAVHSDTDQADFFHSIAITPEGPGRTESVSLSTGSKVAGQLEWAISEKFSATTQVLVKQYEDGEWAPRVEWAFVKYEATNNLDVRVGRIRPPVYMLSDFLDVNYANPWVRPPVEQYYNIPVTNMDGIDVLWRPSFAGYSFLVQPYYGEKDLDAASASSNEYVGVENFGLNLTASSGDFTYRFGYWEADLDMQINEFKQAAFGLQSICAAYGDPITCEQSELLNLDDVNYRFLSTGVSWDNGDYFAQGEFGRAISNSTTVADSTSYYLSGGMRLGLWTPFVSFSNFDNRMPQSFTESSIPTTNAIAFGISDNNAQSQNTLAVGVRYDVLPTVSVKAQWDHTATTDCSGSARTCRGMFGRSTDVFRATEQDVNLISVAVDFIF